MDILENIKVIKANIGFMNKDDREAVFKILNKYQPNHYLTKVSDEFIVYNNLTESRTLMGIRESLFNKLRYTEEGFIKNKKIDKAYYRYSSIYDSIFKKYELYYNDDWEFSSKIKDLDIDKISNVLCKIDTHKEWLITHKPKERFNKEDISREDIPNWIFNAYVKLNNDFRENYSNLKIRQSINIQKEILKSELLNHFKEKLNATCK